MLPRLFFDGTEPKAHMPLIIGQALFYAFVGLDWAEAQCFLPDSSSVRLFVTNLLNTIF